MIAKYWNALITFNKSSLQPKDLAGRCLGKAIFWGHSFEKEIMIHNECNVVTRGLSEPMIWWNQRIREQIIVLLTLSRVNVLLKLINFFWILLKINTRRINFWMVIALLTRIHWIQILNIYPIWESRNVYHKKNVKMLYIHLFWWWNRIEENRGEISLPVCTAMHESIYAI